MMIKLAMASFALWVLDGDDPPYVHDDYPSFERCVEAARGEVESMGPHVQWQCIPVRKLLEP